MSARFSSVLVANRGEIACRIIRAARAEGLRAIAVYSEADAEALHVRLADAAVCIGPATAAQSYLSIDALIRAAKAAGAEAVHPGYGFLAESADFAERCAAAGVVFVGPPPAAMRAMGDKSKAKARMMAAGVPCAPGYHGEDQSPARFAEEARRIGYPLMVKASAGGGGRGMRIVRSPDALDAAVRSASAEAASAFGDGRLILERALLGARHVEIQVFGDEHGAIVHLGERDCSIQRRHQKLIEESPSPAVSPELRARMGAAAVQAARAVGYVSAGTVEFLLADDGSFYFLEMNTRIQVEHPVTECVTGIDLVRLQFQVAQGRPLPFDHSDVALRGHAIEARLYAEDPLADFLPSTGRTLAWRPGEGEGVRVDCGLECGATVGPHYDSLLAKVIAFGSDREEARRRLARALRDTFVAGVATNRDFLIDALGRRDFIDGQATTAFLAGAPPRAAAPSREAIALAALLFVERAGAPAPAAKPTATWRASTLRLAVGGDEARASVSRRGDERIVTLDSEALTMRLLSRAGNDIRFSSGGVDKRAASARDGDELWLDFDGACRRFVDRTYAPPQLKDEDSNGAVRSPVSGVIVGVGAKVGDKVRRGQALATVEAMKMQYSILAPIDGVVRMANASAGAHAQARAVLFAINPYGDH
jgi:geranyl-CoA carboxylase alpha subunit